MTDKKATGINYDCVRRNDCPHAVEAEPKREKELDFVRNYKNSKNYRSADSEFSGKRKAVKKACEFLESLLPQYVNVYKDDQFDQIEKQEFIRMMKEYIDA